MHISVCQNRTCSLGWKHVSDATTLNVISRPTRWPKYVYSCTTQSNLGSTINSNQNTASDSLISHTRHYYYIYCCRCWIPIRPAIQLIHFLTVTYNRLLLTLWWNFGLQYSAGNFLYSCRTISFSRNSGPWCQSTLMESTQLKMRDWEVNRETE